MGCSRKQTTTHFDKRTKKRVGLSKKAAPEFLEKAIKYGFRKEDLVSRPSLLKYAKNCISSRDREFIIYNRYIIVMSPDFETAITVLDLPKQFYSSVESLKKERSYNE